MQALKENIKEGWVNPLVLLTSNRIDVIFKIIYLKFYNLSNTLSKDVYDEHIKIITNGIYKESDTQKEGLENFISSFNKIYADLSKNKFDTSISKIPISKDNTIVNGAHRVAASIYLKQDVYCVKNNSPRSNYNYKFFIDRGINRTIMELGILNYIEYKENVYLALIWPSANKKIDYISRFQDILYQKKFKLNHNGAHNFLAQVYKEQKWVGSFENGYGGAYVKLAESFKNFSPVHAIFFHENNLTKVNQIKSNLREQFGIDKGSIHITDSNNETLELSKYILNDNSLHFLNYAKPYLFKDIFKRLKNFKKKIDENKVNINDLVVDGGTVLSIYGIRKSKDLDYISTKYNFKSSNFDNHNAEARYHNEKIEELIYNPKFYFYFNDFKFISLNQIKNMKILRNELKDQIDVKLIEKKSKKIDFYFLKLIESVYLFKSKFISKMIPLTKKLGVYNFEKFIYKLMFK